VAPVQKHARALPVVEKGSLDVLQLEDCDAFISILEPFLLLRYRGPGSEHLAQSQLLLHVFEVLLNAGVQLPYIETSA
jgi:hypothetical protein